MFKSCVPIQVIVLGALQVHALNLLKNKSSLNPDMKSYAVVNYFYSIFFVSFNYELLSAIS